MSEIMIVVKEPKKHSVARKVENDLESLQEIVGGYLEQGPIFHEDIMILVKDLATNKDIPNIDTWQGVYQGTVIAVKFEDSEMVSMTEEEADKARIYLDSLGIEMEVSAITAEGIRAILDRVSDTVDYFETFDNSRYHLSEYEAILQEDNPSYPDGVLIFSKLNSPVPVIYFVDIRDISKIELKKSEDSSESTGGLQKSMAFNIDQKHEDPTIYVFVGGARYESEDRVLFATVSLDRVYERLYEHMDRSYYNAKRAGTVRPSDYPVLPEVIGVEVFKGNGDIHFDRILLHEEVEGFDDLSMDISWKKFDTEIVPYLEPMLRRATS